VKFEIPPEKQEALKAFQKHKCDFSKAENIGAIGGRLTYKFTPTGVGCCFVVECVCGESVDLSGYEDW